MRLALIENIGNAVKLEYDLDIYQERLVSIAFEYYLGNKDKLSRKSTKVGLFKVIESLKDDEVQDILKKSFEYAFKILTSELKKQSVKIL